MNIILGVAGSIAAYKAAEIASKLTQESHTVSVIMTPCATEFITPLTFQALTRRPVLVSLEDEKQFSKPGHIQLADEADMMVIAPTTANQLAKLALGIADESLVATYLALNPGTPVLICPAMNGKMWLHPATQRHVKQLRSDGCVVIEPADGHLACGYQGVGRLADPEQILSQIKTILRKK